MNKGVLVWGYFSSFILLLGAIFMNLNLVAGKVLYLSGFLAFNLGYLIPLFNVIFRKNQENKIGIVLIFGILGFLCFLTGVSFYVINWGGGIVLIYTGGGILILAILSIIALSRRFYETHINTWFPVLVFGVFIIISLLTGMVHRHVMRVFSVNNKEAINLLFTIKEKNTSLYKQLYTIQTNDTLLNNADITICKEVILKTINSIDSIKIALVSEVENEKKQFFEAGRFDNLVPVQSNVEINAVRRFMLHKQKGEAYKLKKQLDELKTTLINEIPSSEEWLKSFIELSLYTNSYELGNRRFNKSWEHQQFYGFPLVTVLNQLSKIQLNIINIESEILHMFLQKKQYPNRSNELISTPEAK